MVLTYFALFGGTKNILTVSPYRVGKPYQKRGHLFIIPMPAIFLLRCKLNRCWPFWLWYKHNQCWTFLTGASRTDVGHFFYSSARQSNVGHVFTLVPACLQNAMSVATTFFASQVGVWFSNIFVRGGVRTKITSISAFLLFIKMTEFSIKQSEPIWYINLYIRWIVIYWMSKWKKKLRSNMFHQSFFLLWIKLIP